MMKSKHSMGTGISTAIRWRRTTEMPHHASEHARAAWLRSSDDINPGHRELPEIQAIESDDAEPDDDDRFVRYEFFEVETGAKLEGKAVRLSMTL
jgi:hypothetical protein